MGELKFCCAEAELFFSLIGVQDKPGEEVVFLVMSKTSLVPKRFLRLSALLWDIRTSVYLQASAARVGSSVGYKFVTPIRADKARILSAANNS